MAKNVPPLAKDHVRLALRHPIPLLLNHREQIARFAQPFLISFVDKSAAEF
jgi:hypothetical protein